MHTKYRFLISKGPNVMITMTELDDPIEHYQCDLHFFDFGLYVMQ